MRPSGSLLAWLEPGNTGEVAAVFIGEPVFVDARDAQRRRAPARRVHSSPERARAWVEAEAAALGLPVAWLDAAPAT